MTSRGTKYWKSGAIPLIGPDILGGIISTLADLALVISPKGEILSVLANPDNGNFADLDHWEHGNVREYLTIDSLPKFEKSLAAYLENPKSTRTTELNHVDRVNNFEFPINYTIHRIGPDDAILMLGRDLRPIAEMQQQLVKAQMALENDYESRREYDTQFQVLLRQTREAVLFLSVGAGRITELNVNAARLLGQSRERLIGTPLAELTSGGSDEGLSKQLIDAGQSDDPGRVLLTSTRTDRQFRVYPTLFRAGGERLLLCRLEPINEAGLMMDNHTTNIVALFENGVDGILMTDQEGYVLSANEAFLNLADAPDLKSIKGRQLSNFLMRGVVDQKTLLENASNSGHLRLFSTRIVGEYGAHRPVTVSATYLSDTTSPCFAFVMRDSSLDTSMQTGSRETVDNDNRPVMELVGSAPLRDIVAQSTDVIERICIETALELTKNNRVAAAEMLGLSRQSLYVKLRKHGLIGKDG